MKFVYNRNRINFKEAKMINSVNKQNRNVVLVNGFVFDASFLLA